MIGQTISHYKIVSKIGQGGMGEVYLAEDTRLDRRVALKFLAPELARDRESLIRFRNEAKAAAELSHPNIATIYDIGDVEGKPFLVLEYLEGQTLRERVTQGPLPIEDVLRIGKALAAGLAEAHEHGIVHRDIKSANVMLTDKGELKILDFGLAHRGDSTQLTRPGTTLGTIGYMSPEQAHGKTADERSDIWSLGVVLYECLTGQLPFTGEGTAVIEQIKTAEPAPPTALRTGIPLELEQAVLRCLEKDAQLRYQHTDDVLAKLKGVEIHLSGPSQALGTEKLTETTGRKRRSPWPWVGLGAAVVAVALYFGFLRGEDSTPGRELTSRALTSFVGMEVPGSWSPDGGFFAYSHSMAGPMDIFVTSTSGGKAIHLVESSHDDIWPRWSPDNRWIAFVSDRGGRSGIYIVPPLGGEPQLLVETGFPVPNNLSGTIGSQPWSPDGSSLIFKRRGDEGGDEVWKIDLESRTESRLTRPPAGTTDHSPSYSTQGDRIAFGRWDGSASHLMIMPADGGKAEDVGSDDQTYWSHAWSPNGESCIYNSDSGGLFLLDLDSGERSQLTTSSDDLNPVVARDGRVLYNTATHQTDLFVQAITGGSERRLTNNTKDNFQSRYSPDSQFVAYESNRTGNDDIWLIDLETGSERQLTQREADDWGPSWTPDSSEVVFGSNHGGSRGFWAVSVAGGSARQLGVYENAIIGQAPRVSPDGKLIGFIALSEGIYSLYVIGRDGGDARKVLDDVHGFEWYRDSSRVIYTPKSTEMREEIRVANIESREEALLLTVQHSEIRVARGGGALTYIDSVSHFNMNLFLVTLSPPPDASGLPTAVGPPKRVTNGEGAWHVHNGDISADGKRVVYTRDTDAGDIYVLDGVF